MTDKANIREIFVSIQGEGPYVGYKQLFIRFCSCNLNCKYCDTDFDISKSKQYTVSDILEEIEKHSDCHSVALTGGEPLLNTGFLKELLPQCQLPVYLETNAILSGELGEIIDYVDYVAADIKLPSCTGTNAYWTEHDAFFEKVGRKELFAKIIFDENITEEEISHSAKLGAKYGIELILQPKTTADNPKIDSEFAERTLGRFLEKYKKVRLIPQIHKFLGLH